MSKVSYIQLNDIVLIAGLYGDEYNQINSKLGRVKEIMFTGDHYYSRFSAKIFIEGNYHVVDYDYLFKLNDLKIDIHEHSIIIGNPTIYYVMKYGLTNVTGLIDEYVQYNMVGKTEEHIYKTFLISGMC